MVTLVPGGAEAKLPPPPSRGLGFTVIRSIVSDQNGRRCLLSSAVDAAPA